MVGIVLVSHSAELAASVKALGKAAIAAVMAPATTQPYGTDAVAIMDAISRFTVTTACWCS
jgi:dihydroxyacetone kinase DhaKLM complex PTS-EIIA-like component DhaM